MMNQIDAIPIQVDPLLQGVNKAVKRGRIIYVSPAIWSLMKNAQGKELEDLLAKIPLLDLGDASPFVGPMGPQRAGLPKWQP